MTLAYGSILVGYIPLHIVLLICHIEIEIIITIHMDMIQ